MLLKSMIKGLVPFSAIIVAQEWVSRFPSLAYIRWRKIEYRPKVGMLLARSAGPVLRSFESCCGPSVAFPFCSCGSSFRPCRDFCNPGSLPFSGPLENQMPLTGHLGSSMVVLLSPSSCGQGCR
jgi:hypothetical protein